MLKRKDKILISAIEILAEDGITGLTTKHLAEVQGVTEPALYRQYKNKQEIILAIINEFTYYDSKIINTINEKGIIGIEAISFYIKRFSELYVNYYELTTVMFSMDLFLYNDITRKIMEEATKARLEFLEQVIDQGQVQVLTYKSVELASLIDGILVSQVYQWRMSDKDYTLEDTVETLVKKLLSIE